MKLKYVIWDKDHKRYRSTVSVMGVVKRLGRYKCPIEANKVAVDYLNRFWSEEAERRRSIGESGEVWADIKGLEGFYQISSFGRVKSLRSSKIILVPVVDKKGYVKHNLKGKNYFVHRLVAKHFLGLDTSFCRERVVDHIDSNKENNRAINLRIVSALFNTLKDSKNDSSCYPGVHFSKGKWIAHYKGNRIGTFETDIEAAKAYYVVVKKDYPNLLPDYFVNLKEYPF